MISAESPVPAKSIEAKRPPPPGSSADGNRCKPGSIGNARIHACRAPNAVPQWAADLAQDGELLLVKPGDRRSWTDVGQPLGGDALALALAGALVTDEWHGRIL